MAKKSILKSIPSAQNDLEDVVVEEQKRLGARKKDREKKSSLYTSVETWKALQMQRIQEERPVNDIVNDAISAYLRNVGGPENK